MAGPALAEGKCKTDRDKCAEQPLGDPAAENSLHALVDMHSGAESITMSQHETFARMRDKFRAMMNFDPKALEIAIAPDVVVSAEEMDLDSPGDQRLKRREHTGITGRHHIPVLIPEIPDVAKKINSLRLFGRSRL